MCIHIYRRGRDSVVDIRDGTLSRQRLDSFDAVGGGKREAGSREQDVGSGSGKQRLSVPLPASRSPLPATVFRLPASGFPLPAQDSRPTSMYRYTGSSGYPDTNSAPPDADAHHPPRSWL